MTDREEQTKRIVNCLKENEKIPERMTKATVTILIEALEKELPKEVTDEETCYDGAYGRCPNCHSHLYEGNSFKRCRECGQKIIWRK